MQYSDFDDMSNIFDDKPLADVKSSTSQPTLQAAPPITVEEYTEARDANVAIEVPVTPESTEIELPIDDEVLSDEPVTPMEVDDVQELAVEVTPVEEVVDDQTEETSAIEQEDAPAMDDEDSQSAETMDETQKEITIPETLFSTAMPTMVNTDNPADQHVINKSLQYFMNKSVRQGKLFDVMSMRAHKARSSDAAVIWEEGYGSAQFGSILITADSEFNPKTPIYTKTATDPSTSKTRMAAFVPVSENEYILLAGHWDGNEYAAVYEVTELKLLEVKDRPQYDLQLTIVAECYNYTSGGEWQAVGENLSDEQITILRNTAFVKVINNTIHEGGRTRMPIFTTRYVDKYVDVSDYQSCISDLSKFANEPVAYPTIDEMYESVESKLTTLFDQPLTHDEMVSVVTVLHYVPEHNAVVVTLLTSIYDHSKRSSANKRMFIDRTILREGSEYTPLKLWRTHKEQKASFEMVKEKLISSGANIANVKCLK